MNPYQDAMQNLHAVAQYLDSTDIIRFLEEPKQSIEISIPFKAGGTIQMIKGFRVQYNDALGPTKGGIRFHPQSDLEETKALAFWMTIKNGLMGLPYGGAKGSLAIDPRNLSRKRLQWIAREYIRSLHRNLGPRRDIPAPDVGTNPEIMAWMMDEYSRIQGEHITGVITGKPLLVGGSQVRSHATSLGGFHILNLAISQYGMRQTGVDVVIQGFGNAGQHMAAILENEGHRIIAVSDSKSAVYRAAGLDVKGLIDHKHKTGSVDGFAEASPITQEDLLSTPADVLVLAALAGTVTKQNAPGIKASLVLELANGPVTKEAEQLLLQRDVIVLPDILANAGGVTVSYFEWVQNLSGDMWSEEYINKRLYSMMKRAFEEAHHIAREKDIDLRMAAYVLALQRIAQAETLRGRLST
ncbi:MAG: Glu/Leu/Phe/Val family dehydrogenase [Nanobdellota archaeon]